MKKNAQQKKLLCNFLILVCTVSLLFLSACKKTLNDESFRLSENLEDWTTINKAAINPIVLKYQENIASVLEYYYKNPEKRKTGGKNFRSIEGDTLNAFLEKANSINIEDSAGVTKNIFDLSSEKFSEIVTAMTLTDGTLMTKKINIDTSGQMLAGIDSFNQMFANANGLATNTAQGGRLISTTSFKSDPYFNLKNYEKTLRSNMPTSITSIASARTSEQDFWWTAIANGLLSQSIVHIAPSTLTAQTFVNRIKPNISKGRLLVSLPGGFNTWFPIVLYFNQQWYDVGHVGVLTGNKDVVRDINGYNSEDKIDIGANLLQSQGQIDGVQEEFLGAAWCQKHGISFVGQIFDVKWVWRWRGFRSGLYREQSDIDNNSFYNRVEGRLGKGYCRWYEILTAKWAHPDRFICSSLPQWAAKHANDVNIGDWWKTTIFPAGVYLSDRVRIIDNTLW